MSTGDAGPTGVLVTNLGTPAAPTPAAVRRYLAEFLSDSRVIDLPRWLWLPILHGIILRVRPRRSAAAYRAIWGEDGSPLLANAERQAAGLERALEASHPGDYRVALGMRYGEPSIAGALGGLRDAGVTRLLVLPLYPQYSYTTTGSTRDAVLTALGAWPAMPELRFVCDYHDQPGYIDALAASVTEFRAREGRAERLLMSFHGLPRRYCEAGDPYDVHCLETARLLAARLDEPDGAWAVSFQSRVGREEWLKPYTEELLEDWAGSGVRTVDVLCPGFSADCLETLEEIAIRGAESFTGGGGARLRYIPALNDRPDHIALLADMVRTRTDDWQRPGVD